MSTPRTPEQKAHKKIHDAEYRAAHRDKLRAQARARHWEKREQILEYLRTYYASHAEQYSARAKLKYQEDKEAIKQKVREWRLANPERKRETSRAWHIAHRVEDNKKAAENLRLHPEWRHTGSVNRRAREMGAPGKMTTREWLAFCDAIGNRCMCCNRSVKLTVDHVIPLSRGGTNGIENVQALCGRCNSRKSIKVIDFRVGWEAT